MKPALGGSPNDFRFFGANDSARGGGEYGLTSGPHLTIRLPDASGRRRSASVNWQTKLRDGTHQRSDPPQRSYSLTASSGEARLELHPGILVVPGMWLKIRPAQRKWWRPLLFSVNALDPASLKTTLDCRTCSPYDLLRMLGDDRIPNKALPPLVSKPILYDGFFRWRPRTERCNFFQDYT